jgi:copper chaperone CopZ
MRPSVPAKRSNLILRVFIRRSFMRSFLSFCLAAILAGTGLGCQKRETVNAGGGADLGVVSADQPDTAVMWVHGMGCPQCSYNVDLQLMKVPGVEKVRVDMGTGRVFAQLSPSRPPTSEQLSQAIKETGFTLVRIDMPSNRSPSSS